MEKYKICPGCGKHNDPRLMECDECGTDLTGVPIVDDNIVESKANKSDDDEAPNNVDSTDDSETAQGFVRVCTACGHRNPSQARKCETCGEDISDVVPVPEGSVSEKKHYYICDLDGQHTFPIPTGNTVIGREQELKSYLADKPFVSRTHARLINNDEGLFVENLSRTNFTYINNIKIGEGLQKLNCGDVLSLGGIEKNGVRQSQAAFFVVVNK